jgi:hypothetical protein
LDRLGIEFDQRMYRAWEMCASLFVTELHLLTALRALGTRGLECLPYNWDEVANQLEHGPVGHFSSLCTHPHVNLCHPSSAEAALRFDTPIWCRAVELAKAANTISASAFCRAISTTFLKGWSEESSNIPPLLKFLAICHGEPLDDHAAMFEEIPGLLAEMPRTRGVIQMLGRLPEAPDDFQYLLCMEHGNPIFRTVSSVGELVLKAPNHSLLPARALLRHFKQKFGAFTRDEIEELEELIRHPKATEQEFQKFFERHPHFFRRWDIRQVYPQVYLASEDPGTLIPDFILTNPDVQRAAVLELKLPRPKLVTRQKNRERFAACVMAARTQLLAYRDWFERKGNRDRLKKVVGMEVFRPQLAVVIGSSAWFEPGIDRQKLRSEHPDVEVVTYDDLLDYARSRLLELSGTRQAATTHVDGASSL